MTTSTITMMARVMAVGIQIGASTHSQLQLMTPVSFRTMKATALEGAGGADSPHFWFLLEDPANCVCLPALSAAGRAGSKLPVVRRWLRDVIAQRHGDCVTNAQRRR